MATVVSIAAIEGAIGDSAAITRGGRAQGPEQGSDATNQEPEPDVTSSASACGCAAEPLSAWSAPQLCRNRARAWLCWRPPCQRPMDELRPLRRAFSCGEARMGGWACTRNPVEIATCG